MKISNKIIPTVLLDNTEHKTIWNGNSSITVHEFMHMHVWDIWAHSCISHAQGKKKSSFFF